MIDIANKIKCFFSNGVRFDGEVVNPRMKPKKPIEFYKINLIISFLAFLSTLIIVGFGVKIQSILITALTSILCIVIPLIIIPILIGCILIIINSFVKYLKTGITDRTFDNFSIRIIDKPLDEASFIVSIVIYPILAFFLVKISKIIFI